MTHSSAGTLSARTLSHQNLGPARLSRSSAGLAVRSHALVNPAFRSSANRALARSTFAGKFAGDRFWKHHHHHGFVIGWYGPLFWPYAYDDLFGYTFWPYAYDTFWPYAYDDIYEGIYGRYGYLAEPAIVVGKSAARRTARNKLRSERAAIGICSNRVPAWSDWPVERIAQQVNPDAPQQAVLEELKSATATAVQILQSTCPTEVASTPIGRIEATEQRLNGMLRAVETVRPALDKFYDTLNDEQKARFNALATGPDTTNAGQARKDLAQICSSQGRGIADLRTERIDRVVRPNETQHAALDKLKAASLTAGQTLKANCPTYAALTPTSRVAAMEQRLSAALEAVKTVRPALEEFYRSLSDEQKARFNTIGSPAS